MFESCLNFQRIFVVLFSGFFTSLRVSIKFIALMFVVVLGVMIMSPGLILLRLHAHATKKYYLIPILHYITHALFWVFNIQVKRIGHFEVLPGTTIVCNHQSYFDIFVNIYLLKTTFLCAKDAQDIPVISSFIKLGGCLFIDRNNKANIKSEIKDHQEHLNYGINVLFYPEGKCTDGTEMLNFKRPFFRPAMDTNGDVLCLTINYQKVNGKEIDRDTKGYLLWFRQITIAEHFFRLLAVKEAEVEVTGVIVKLTDLPSDKSLPEYCREQMLRSFKVLP